MRRAQSGSGHEQIASDTVITACSREVDGWHEKYVNKVFRSNNASGPPVWKEIDPTPASCQDAGTQGCLEGTHVGAPLNLCPRGEMQHKCGGVCGCKPCHHVGPVGLYIVCQQAMDVNHGPLPAPFPPAPFPPKPPCSSAVRLHPHGQSSPLAWKSPSLVGNRCGLFPSTGWGLMAESLPTQIWLG